MRWFIPYGNPTYFIWLALAIIPLMIGLLYGRRFRGYQTIISLFFLILTFGGPNWKTGIALIGYFIYQIILVAGYSHYRQKKRISQSRVDLCNDSDFSDCAISYR